MMNNFEERLASVRQGIMKRAAAMKEKAKKQGFEFKPFSRKQKQVLTWWCPSSPVKDKDGIIADGAIRSGKTLCMSLSYVLWAMESFNQQNFGMAGKTIGSFQNTQFELADMKTRIEAARYLVYHAACAKDAGEPYADAAAMAKLFASETAREVTWRAVQLFGGYGYTRDYPVERMMRDAKITEIYEGTSEIQKMVISANLLK